MVVFAGPSRRRSSSTHCSHHGPNGDPTQHASYQERFVIRLGVLVGFFREEIFDCLQILHCIGSNAWHKHKNRQNNSTQRALLPS